MEPYNSLEEPVDPTVHDTNETRLWRAVVLQAIVDATETDLLVTASTSMARDKARTWFFTASTTTREEFEQVCDLADLDFYAVRTIVKRCINEGRRVSRAQLTAALRVGESNSN